jgi:hypothetical protein
MLGVAWCSQEPIAPRAQALSLRQRRFPAVQAGVDSSGSSRIVSTDLGHDRSLSHSRRYWPHASSHTAESGDYQPRITDVGRLSRTAGTLSDRLETPSCDMAGIGDSVMPSAASAQQHHQRGHCRQHTHDQCPHPGLRDEFGESLTTCRPHSSVAALLEFVVIDKN